MIYKIIEYLTSASPYVNFDPISPPLMVINLPPHGHSGGLWPLLTPQNPCSPRLRPMSVYDCEIVSLLLLRVIGIGRPLFGNFVVLFAIARHRNSAILLILSVRVGVCACMCVSVCLYVCECKKGPGMFPHSYWYHQRSKTSVFADFWKTRDGRTDGRSDGQTLL